PFFLLTVTPPTALFTLSLHDALPISSGLQAIRAVELVDSGLEFAAICQTLENEVFKNKVFFNVATLEYLQKGGRIGLVTAIFGRSEEHTSELQSRFDLVCRLLLEKKK